MKHVIQVSTLVDDIIKDLKELPNAKERTKQAVSRRFQKLEERMEKENRLEQKEGLQKQLAELKT
jgi:hypothetical protein